MSLEQIKALHRRPGESVKERSRLWKTLDVADRAEAVGDAIGNNKSTMPFGDISCYNCV